MGKNKLKKFSDLDIFDHVIQIPYRDLGTENHPLRGNWNKEFFKNDNPIVLELGCGKGEYTVGLGKLKPNVNYIGVDIKGSRMWQGAKFAEDHGMKNIGFLRTHIELISQIFGANEISEIWLTFPDPQMKKTRKRLTSTRFVGYFRKMLKPNGMINLKTDSQFQYTYTYEMAKVNNFEIVENITNVYKQDKVSDVLQIQTFYGVQWINRGLSIKYISFIPHQNDLIEPDVEIEEDTYRSFGRGAVNVDEMI